MSYGMFTLQRSELSDPARLREKLETATGSSRFAEQLAVALERAAAEDPATATWHLVPAAPEGKATGWRLEPMGGA